MTLNSPRRTAALEACATFLCPGRKWRLSPYLSRSLDESGLSELAHLVPVYQSVVLDLLRDGWLPQRFRLLDIGSPSGIGSVAVLDALLAWHTACSIFEVEAGFDTVGVETSERSVESTTQPLIRTYQSVLLARTRELPALECLDIVAGWLDAKGPAINQIPDLVLWNFSPDSAEYLVGVLDQAAHGTVVVGLTWQQAGENTELFRWRRNLLHSRSDVIALGPCGQEYGRDLPLACNTCTHGRREAWHSSGIARGYSVPPWTYAVLAKRTDRDSGAAPSLLAAEALTRTEIDAVDLRYVGTVREKVISANHPDDTQDNPGDEKWREYLKTCPGKSGACRIAIERRAGMQVPRLQYGGWIHVQHVRPHQLSASQPDAYMLRVRSEASFHAHETPSIEETFLTTYQGSVRAAVDEAGYRLFGFPRMRDFQHTILARVLCGRDILAIAATGGGKSECFILPAMLLPGITVVVSPLKSLILDQYEQRIRDRYGLDHLATFINSDVSFYERQGRLRRMVLGHYKLVYVTPEQLERSYVLDALRQADETVGLRYLAMDEAHCISQWGHDFRPSYLNLVQRLRDYGLRPRRIALTATASPLVRDDVCAELHLNPADVSRGGDVFIDSSNRPELNLVARRVRNTAEKAKIIVNAVGQLGSDGSAIVFMPHTGGSSDKPRDMGAPRTNPRPENVGMVSPGVTPFADYLQRQLNQPVAMYHGSLDDEAAAGGSTPRNGDNNDDNLETDGSVTRQAEQRDFLAGRKRIMVATKGFGMGVDKPDIRLVIHRSPPGNLEAYVQEAGRAGRDGRLATVMLLVSNDEPEIVAVPPTTYLARNKLPSDNSIQRYFIEQRYVRRIDVEAMLAFLRSDRPQRVHGALYFTNDQVMRHFEECAAKPGVIGLAQAYQWPAFEPRRASRSYEPPDHTTILDRGHLYKQRRDYIGRILSVLFNTRPSVNGQALPAVRSVHEVGTLLREFRLHQSQKILDSPTYFGKRLRQAGVTVSEFQQLLPNGRLTNIAPLATRLELSLRETVSMLTDIRWCEGHTKDKHWVGNWLNFWWPEAPRNVDFPAPHTDLAAWRAHAGASRRNWSSTGGSRLDDIFPWGVVNRPSGWEVTLDLGFEHASTTAYLDAFMTLHDERRQNDESNFAYLMERYVGNGTHPAECLRSLLLGYLKTGEVVAGGKCFGCSVCVPDLAFDRHPPSVRQQVVVRLFAETLALIEQVEASNRATPGSQALEGLLDAILFEDAQGRSGTAYLDSWLARVIQDDPEHEGALWVRLRAVRRGMLTLSDQDLLTTVTRLVRLAKTPESIAFLGEALEQYREDPRLASVRLPIAVLAAELAQRLRRWQDEAIAWQEVVKLAEVGRVSIADRPLLERALSRSVDLHRPDGPVPDPDVVQDVAMRLTRLPNASPQTAEMAYKLIVTSWRWRDLEMELSSSQVVHPYASATAWLETVPLADHTAMARWLQRHPDRWSAWPVYALTAMEEKLGSALDGLPETLLALGDAFSDESAAHALAARTLVRAWSAGADLSSTHLRQISWLLTQLDVSWFGVMLARRQSDAAALLDDLWRTGGDSHTNVEWFLRLSPESMQPQPEVLIQGILRDLAASPSSKQTLSALAGRLNIPSDSPILRTLLELAQQQPELATQFMKRRAVDAHLERSAAVQFFSVLVRNRGDVLALRQILDAMASRDLFAQGDDLMALCLDNWQALTADRLLWSELRRDHVDGSTLVGIATKWLAYADKPHRLDMLVIILQDVRSRSPATWLTPVSLEFQTLCAAGRLAEAENLLKRFPSLNVKGQDARQYFSTMARNIRQRPAPFTQEFTWLWVLAK